MRCLVICLILGLFTLSAAQADEMPKFASEDEVVAYLKTNLKCTPHAAGTIHCELDFRGLKVSFWNVTGDGVLTVIGMGENQELRPVSRKCIVVWFGDVDLRFPDQSQVVFQNNGRISLREHVDLHNDCK